MSNSAHFLHFLFRSNSSHFLHFFSAQIPLIPCIFCSAQIPLISCIFFNRFRSFRSNSAHSGHLLHFFERILSGLLDLGVQTKVLFVNCHAHFIFAYPLFNCIHILLKFVITFARVKQFQAFTERKEMLIFRTLGRMFMYMQNNKGTSD